MTDMLGRGDLIPLNKALALLENMALAAPQTERIPIEDACGRILAETVVSSEDVPHFARSTMDGYALNAEDTFGATETLPAYIKVISEVFMGRIPDFGINRGEAAKIPTGGMLPDGADAVLMFEHSQPFGAAEIEALKAVAPGDNVIQKGQDIHKGDDIVRLGHKIRPQDMGAVAAVGISELSVYKRPVVSIISTGDEIIPPGRPLKGAEVRDINSYNLCGLLIDGGAVAARKGIFRDDYDTIRSAVTEAIGSSQMVLITGGSSVGTQDMTARIIDGIGSPGVIFHGVAVKPGKPLIAGAVKGVPVFGLPGHPAAVTVSFEVFIKPVLRRLTGQSEAALSTKVVKARLASNVSSQPARTDFIWVKVSASGEGLVAQPLLSKSGFIATLVKADGVVEIPADKRGLQKDDEVFVRLF